MQTRRAEAQARRPTSLRVLAYVVDAHQPPSRAALAAATGLSRATVSATVDQLVDAGLLRELDPVLTRRVGRPAVPLVPASGTLAGIGMEISADHVGVRVLDLGGAVLSERVDYADLRDADPVAVVDRLASLLDPVVEALDEQGVRTVGATLALPGLVDQSSGVLHVAQTLGWRDLNLGELLRTDRTLARLDPVLSDAAKLAALAEARSREEESFVYVCGEAGVGGAVVLDRQVLSGAHGWAGAIGHIVVDPMLGADGTLERLAGPDVLVRASGLGPSARTPALLAAIEAGDVRASEMVRRGGEMLGRALASVVHVTDVSTVVLGGAFWSLTDHLAPPLLAELRRRVVLAPWVDFQVDRAHAGDLPALTGAAWMSVRRMLDDPRVFQALLDR
ncbi:MAG: ROK family transcriptional regulator [Micrococcales bacterium]|nr:ROK family transcriptional regulator [Micrococcales bacterium]